jgi:hypothetical protein
MKATLDGTIDFEQTKLDVGSWRRDSIERAASGVDGVVSVDLGRRARDVVQKGVIRAKSRSALMANVDSIRDMADGACHTMETIEGERFENLRIDSIKTGGTDYIGAGACQEIEIKYTQLRDS